MIELFLGVIAVSVLAMAIGQVVAVVIATRAQGRRRADGARSRRRFGRSSTTCSGSPTTLHAPRPLRRAGRAGRAAHGRCLRRGEETLTALQDTILRPVQNGWAVLHGVGDGLRAFFDRGNYRSRSDEAADRRPLLPKTMPRSSADVAPRLEPAFAVARRLVRWIAGAAFAVFLRPYLLPRRRPRSKRTPPAPGLVFAFELHVNVGAPVMVGQMPRGQRRIVSILGGTFEGPNIKGKVVPGGADWQIIRADGFQRARYALHARNRQGAAHLRAERRYASRGAAAMRSC